MLEVLSPSTGKTDVAEKVVEYRSIPSEQHRVTGGTFTFVGVDLDLDQIYDFVDRREHAAGPDPG